MNADPALHEADRAVLAELSPVLRRAAGLDPAALGRLRFDPRTVTVLARLPFGVLASRTVASTGEPAVRDVTLRASELLRWLDGDGDGDRMPARRDAEWRGGLPPSSGWRRIETVPDDVIRPLVRTGALALKELATQGTRVGDGDPGASGASGAAGAHAPAVLADALLDSVVLTVDDDRGASAAVTLRALSALTRMGFLPRGGQAHVDVAGRWIRVVGGYGTVALERPGAGLGLLSR